MFKRFQGLPQASDCSSYRALEVSDLHTSTCAADWQNAQVSQDSRSQTYLRSGLTSYYRLREVERKIRRTLDLSTIFGTTVVEAAALFSAYQTVLIQFDAKLKSYRQVSRYCRNQSLAWQSAFGFSQADFPSLLEQLWQGEPICLLSHAQLINTGQAVNELVRSPADLNREVQIWQSRWSGSWLLIPIQKHFPPSSPRNSLASALGSQHWGILALALADDQDWPAATIDDAQSIASELSTAMAHSFLYQELLTTNQELQKLALSDGLTSIANRRRFDKYIEDEWQRLAREQQPLSLILCDIDHFKLFNDTFGHPAGDRCLIHIARALLKVPQRSADLVARYGGEEFAIVLPTTDTEGAWRIAQSVHKSIQALQIAHAASSTGAYVTVTMGISTIIPGQDNTTQTLIRAADIALYYAKQQGRNRTYINGHHNTVNLANCALKAEASPESRLKLTPNE
jgi:diguanylate cyclase (GGDEF)-like protein